MIAIFDYGSGNLRSALRAFETTGQQVVVTSDIQTLKSAQGLVIPGVGAFSACVTSLLKFKASEIIQYRVAKQLPIFGICVGMQMMGNRSDEGKEEGLKWIDGDILKFDEKLIEHRTKLPHMGWNEVVIRQNTTLFDHMTMDKHFYFVHSYQFIAEDQKNVAASTFYQDEITVAVLKDNIFGTQFHPEKSQKNGIQILENFIKW